MLKVIASYKNNGKPQRQLIRIGDRGYRRIEATFDVKKRGFISHPPIWQEQIHTGEFHNIVSKDICEDLESQYQTFLANKSFFDK